jgi:FkbM family methyltransferase
MDVAYTHRMLGPLKKLRSVPWINAAGRSLLRAAARGTQSAVKAAQSRWPVFGPVDVSFGGARFVMHAGARDLWPTDLYYGNNFEVGEATFFGLAAPHASVIVDVGANCGTYSLLASKRNPSARIFAFEPLPANYDALVRNLELNGATNVDAHRAAVGPEPGKVAFTVPADGGMSDVASVVGAFSEAHYGIPYRPIEVEQVTLDGFLGSRGARSDLLKIDVE